MSLLEVRALNAGYGRVQVLWDIDLTVEHNQIVALVGANGAGKTTLLRAISGMIPTRGGSVTLAGTDITGLPAEAIVGFGIAHVPEGRRLFSGLTVRNNIELGGWRRRSTDIEWVLELFPPLRERLGQIAATMSGGEQQMCAIARGLMSKPTLLMIDELSLGLGPKVVGDILSRLPDIAASGTAVLLVEQDVGTALSVSEQAYVLETGHMALSGRCDDVLADPRIRGAYLGLATTGREPTGDPSAGDPSAPDKGSPSVAG